MNGLIKKLKSGGPAAIITSAFIGPGTVIVATKAGASFGYSLVWAVIFAVVALIVLMEMASRIAIVGKKDLVQGTIDIFPNNKIWKVFIQILMLLAVLTICFAFQAGNLTGGSLGLATILGVNKAYVVAVLAILVLIVTLAGSSKTLELIMKIFVGVMGIIFVVTMLLVRPSISGISAGLVPQIPPNAYLLTLALIGTTLIGINLILHSITSRDKWTTANLEAQGQTPINVAASGTSIKASLSEARWDIGVNIIIGGLITFSIVVTSATVLFGHPIKGNPALAFTQSLQPVLGNSAEILGNLGLFAAGLSSAIAIPFTLKRITNAVFHFKGGADGVTANILAVIAIVFGATLAILGTNPQQIIILAQATSGLFLPLITILILIVANHKPLMGEYTNKLWQNLIGVVVVILTFMLGYAGISKAIHGFLQLIGS